MPAGSQFGVDQITIDFNLKAAAIRRDQADPVNLGFIRLQQFGCQTDSTRGVVSNRAVGDEDVE